MEIIYYEGKPVAALNENLIKDLGVSPQQLERIKFLNKMRILLEARLTEVTDPYLIDLLYRAWTENEFKLQDAWGFPRNSKFHKSWYIPACSCPKMDNDDMYPTGLMVMSADCKIHANKY